MQEKRLLHGLVKEPLSGSKGEQYQGLPSAAITPVESAIGSAVMASVKSAIISPVVAGNRAVAVSTIYAAIAAEDPDSTVPDVSVTGAGGNVAFDYGAANYDAISASDGAAISMIEPTLISMLISAIKSPFDCSAILARRCVGYACSEQSSNQSSSEHPITHRISHGNLPFVPAYLPGTASCCK
jgi:hypothetical protein